MQRNWINPVLHHDPPLAGAFRRLFEPLAGGWAPAPPRAREAVRLARQLGLPGQEEKAAA